MPAVGLSTTHGDAAALALLASGGSGDALHAVGLAALTCASESRRNFVAAIWLGKSWPWRDARP